MNIFSVTKSYPTRKTKEKIMYSSYFFKTTQLGTPRGQTISEFRPWGVVTLRFGYFPGVNSACIQTPRNIACIVLRNTTWVFQRCLKLYKMLHSKEVRIWHE